MKAFEHIYGIEISYDEILFILQQERPDVAFQELRQWHRYLHFDKKNSVYIKQAPSHISSVFQVFIVSTSFKPKIQIRSVLAWSLAMYLCGAFSASLAMPIRPDFPLLWMMLFPIAVVFMAMSAVLFFNVMFASSASSDLKNHVIYLPFEDRYRNIA